MKYEGTRKSSKDKDIDVYIISMGVKEVELLLGLVKTTRRYVPMMLEMMPSRGRLKNFQVTLEEILNKRKGEK